MVQLYYFTSAIHALSNIEKRRVKASRFNELNDPFEWLAPACKKQSDAQFLEFLRSTMNDTHGLICMSESWSDPVQWGHYADHHRGMCLGFEVAPEVARKVSYSSDRTVVDDLSFLMDDKEVAEEWMQDQIICRKFDNWRYEKEWRLHINLVTPDMTTGLYFEDFNDQLRLNQVLLGARCDIHRTTVERALGKLGGVKVARMKLSPFEYAVCDERYIHTWASKVPDV